MNHRRLRALVHARDDLAELDPAARRLALRSLVSEAVGGADLGPLVAELADEIDGFGPVSGLMADPQVTDVLINGPADIWMERAGAIERTGRCFTEVAELYAWVERVLGAAGVRADSSRPIADARLSDGSRVHVVMPPVAPNGPLVSIRRFPPTPYSLERLVDLGLLDGPSAARLEDLVRAGRTIVISGATGTGKTTLLNALLGRVGSGDRVVIIEETPELQPRSPHHVSLVARGPNLEGRGVIDLALLVRCALRMRPSRIVVGEVRGPEALAALQALSTGHRGSMVTVHARSAKHALERLVTLALQARSGASEHSLRRQVEDAFEAVVHLARTGAARRVDEILEVR